MNELLINDKPKSMKAFGRPEYFKMLQSIKEKGGCRDDYREILSLSLFYSDFPHLNKYKKSSQIYSTNQISREMLFLDDDDIEC
jgi:hypothetical protein